MDKVLLDSRQEVNFLVKTFYSIVREDELIGPIFNQQVKDWDHHLERITDFWETNLLFVRNYKGNPVAVHVQVDQNNHEATTQEHFGRWLQLWFETIDAHFIGDNAQIAKNRARNMSTHLFLKMYQARDEESKVKPF